MDRTARGLSAAALIASAIALMQKPVQAAPGNEVYLDEATKQLLIAIAQATGETLDSVKATLDSVRAILGAIRGQAINLNVQGYASNRLSGITGRIWINQVNTVRAYQLPAIPVPDDYQIVIKSWPTNAIGGLIYVGFSQVSVMNSLDQAYPLIPNESIGYRVKRTDAIYVSGTVVGDSVTYTVEQ